MATPMTPTATRPRYRSLQPMATPGAVQPQPTMYGGATTPPAPKPVTPEVPQPPGVIPPPARPTARTPIPVPTSKPMIPEVPPPNGELPPHPTGTLPPREDLLEEKDKERKKETIELPDSPVGSNLRSETYLPGNDPRLAAAQSTTDRAASAVQGYDRNALQAGNEGRYRSVYGNGQVSGTMDELNGAPDRTALAMQKLKDFDAVSNEQRFNETRAFGQDAAKFGRIGMQANNDALGEIYRRIEGDRGRLRNDLIKDVSEGDIADRFRKVEMNTGLAERNADRGFQRTNAALDRASSQTDRNVGDLYDQFDAADSLESRVFNQGQSNRNEYRGERQFQETAAQNSLESRLEKFRLEQELEDQRIRRAAMLAQAGGGY